MTLRIVSDMFEFESALASMIVITPTGDIKGLDGSDLTGPGGSMESVRLIDGETTFGALPRGVWYGECDSDRFGREKKA